MANSEREKGLVGRFVLWAAALPDTGVVLAGPEHVAAIKAAAERIARQALANSRNGRKGAPRPVKTGKRAEQLREAKQRQRAREKENK